MRRANGLLNISKVLFCISVAKLQYFVQYKSGSMVQPNVPGVHFDGLFLHQLVRLSLPDYVLVNASNYLAVYRERIIVGSDKFWPRACHLM